MIEILRISDDGDTAIGYGPEVIETIAAPIHDIPPIARNELLDDVLIAPPIKQ